MSSSTGLQASMCIGNRVTQAGGTNYHSVALRVGFAGHPNAWNHQEVRYYAHAVDPAALK